MGRGGLGLAVDSVEFATQGGPVRDAGTPTRDAGAPVVVPEDGSDCESGNKAFEDSPGLTRLSVSKEC